MKFTTKKTKLLAYALVLFGAFVFSIGVADARIVPVQEIADNIVKSMKELGAQITYSIGSSTIDFKSEDSVEFTFNYGADYLEYADRDTIIEVDCTFREIEKALWISSALSSMLTLSGYEDQEVTDDFNFNDYDRFGIYFETEKYSFEATEEETNQWSVKGEFIRYFKLSLDTDKIANLIKTFDDSQTDNATAIISNIVPILEAAMISTDTITINSKIVDYASSLTEDMMCHIYRSESEQGNYERISNTAYRCVDGYTDTNLKSNTMYYYKTALEGNTKLSDPIGIQTKSTGTVVSPNYTSSNNLPNASTVDNPKTGVSSHAISLITVVVIVTYILKKIKKKTPFSNIK